MSHRSSSRPPASWSTARRRVRLTMSLGGLISRPGASRRIGGEGRAEDRCVRIVVPRRGCRGPRYFFTDWDDAMGANLAAVIATQDAVILGRRSYTEWAQFWPNSQIQPFATFINGVTKYVAHRRPLTEIGPMRRCSTAGWSNSFGIQAAARRRCRCPRKYLGRAGAARRRRCR